MSTFEVPIVRVTKVDHHPNADRLSLVNFRGFTTITAKREDGSHRFAVGDPVVYVPEGSIVPEWLLRQGFWKDDPAGGPGKGLLAGSKGDRVKAIKLRGIVSQGIMFPVLPEPCPEDPVGLGEVESEDGTRSSVYEDQDVASLLGITKYEPPIPIGMGGEVFALGAQHTINFDIENLQKFPHILNDPAEIVVVTEKLHGTFCQIAYIPRLYHGDGFLGGNVFVGSKGLSAQGFMFKATNENLYVKTVMGTGVAENFCGAIRHYYPEARSAYLVGEVYGVGVQDLSYGASKPEFRAFGIRIGSPRGDDGAWLDSDSLDTALAFAGIARVPVLATIPWCEVEPRITAFRDGRTTLGGGHIREGIVITPARERYDNEIGRVILKAVSPDYLLRKGEVTEFA